MKFSHAVQNWQGQWRHPKCDEERHPQDFVHSRNAQEMAIPYPQYPGEAYAEACDLNGISAIPNLAIPDCSIPDNPITMEVPGSECQPFGHTAIPDEAEPNCAIPDEKCVTGAATPGVVKR
jgi:hypothetical protein